MFLALLAYPQEALHKRHLVHCVRVMSVGCYQGWSGTPRSGIKSVSRWFHYTYMLRCTVNRILSNNLMFVPGIITLSRNNQHNAQICTTALFIYAGSYMFWH
jgi:hypothetical protein